MDVIARIHSANEFCGDERIDDARTHLFGHLHDSILEIIQSLRNAL